MQANEIAPYQKHGGPLARAREPWAERLAPWSRQALSLTFPPTLQQLFPVRMSKRRGRGQKYVGGRFPW